jgi:hypothetical protein
MMFDKYWKLALSIFVGALLIVIGSALPIHFVLQLIALIAGLVITVINLIVVTKRLL